MTFTDGTTIDAVEIELNEFDTNVLDICLKTNDYTSVLTTFKDKDKIRTIIDGDNTYVGYTNIRFFQGIEQDGITEINISLVYEGLNKEIDTLKEQLEVSNNHISMLTDCLLEMSDEIYN